MDCTIYVAQTKVLISFAVTAKLICVFVFAYALMTRLINDRNPEETFSYDAAHVKVWIKWLIMIFIDLNGVLIIFINFPDCYYFQEAKFYTVAVKDLNTWTMDTQMILL